MPSTDANQPSFDLVDPEGKAVVVTESAASNNGVRTRLTITLAPYETVPPHLHPHYTEIFQPLYGGVMNIYAGPDIANFSQQETPNFPPSHVIKPGDTLPVAPGEPHRYIVGPEKVVLGVILEPGYPDFEKVPDLLEGIRKDGFAGLGRDIDPVLGGRLLSHHIMALTGTDVLGRDGEDRAALLKDEPELVETAGRIWREKYLS